MKATWLAYTVTVLDAKFGAIRDVVCDSDDIFFTSGS